MKKIIIAVVVTMFFALGVAIAQKATIDYRFNTETPDAKNYLNWSFKDKVIKDGFDAASSASISQSTALLDVIRYDDSVLKNAAIPSGFRCLLLFAVADFSTAQADAFAVEQNKKQLTIRFVHRGVAYQIKTDEKGKINLATSFFMAPGVAANIGGKFYIVDEYLLPNGNNAEMTSLDWNKVNLIPDTASVNAQKKFEGSLNSTFKKGILSVKGNLIQK